MRAIQAQLCCLQKRRSVKFLATERCTKAAVRAFKSDVLTARQTPNAALVVGRQNSLAKLCGEFCYVSIEQISPLQVQSPGAEQSKRAGKMADQGYESNRKYRTAKEWEAKRLSLRYADVYDSPE